MRAGAGAAWAQMPMEPESDSLSLRKLFICQHTDELRIRDVRLDDNGVASVTAEGCGTTQLGFCSVLLGVDCRTQHVSCCYSLDEHVAGSLFDAHRERVVTWAPAPSNAAVQGGGLGEWV